jgi:hypothetical protein
MCIRYAKNHSSQQYRLLAGITQSHPIPRSHHHCIKQNPTYRILQISRVVHATSATGSRSGVTLVGARIPRVVRVNITSILNLAHGRTTATNAATEVRTATTAVHDVDSEGSDERSPAEPQEGAGSLCLAAVLLGVGRRVAHAVCKGVCLSHHISILTHTTSGRCGGMTYRVRATMRTEIRSERNSSAEPEQHAQRIHGNVDDGDAELVEEGCGQEVQQGEEPPHADEEGVVDDGVGAVCGAVDVVGHERCDEDGADELLYVSNQLFLLLRARRTYLPGTKAHGKSSRHHIDGCVICNVVCDKLRR